jgi:hypothetical protein
MCIDRGGEYVVRLRRPALFVPSAQAFQVSPVTIAAELDLPEACLLQKRITATNKQ